MTGLILQAQWPRIYTQMNPRLIPSPPFLIYHKNHDIQSIWHGGEEFIYKLGIKQIFVHQILNF